MNSADFDRRRTISFGSRLPDAMGQDQPTQGTEDVQVDSLEAPEDSPYKRTDQLKAEIEAIEEKHRLGKSRGQHPSVHSLRVLEATRKELYRLEKQLMHEQRFKGAVRP
jgi:hypothetical protein